MSFDDQSSLSLLEYGEIEPYERANGPQLEYLLNLLTSLSFEEYIGENGYPSRDYITTDFSSPSQYFWAKGTFIPIQEIQPQKDAVQQIKQLAQTAGRDNWDGEGAIKVSPETVKVACELVATFPHNVLGGDMDIDATPFGSIDFGWVLERDVMMNIIVLPSSEIGFAYSAHGDRNDGKEPWDGTIPHPISEAFDKVFNRHGFGD